jgi:hypothetical protein
MTEDSKHIKNIPIIQNPDDIIQSNLNFNEGFYEKFQEFINHNPGKTTLELCEIITFYDFTEKTLDTAFRVFNTWKNTYYGVCGPFIYTNYRWFPVYSKKYNDTVMLAEENSILRARLEEYKKLLKNEESSSS